MKEQILAEQEKKARAIINRAADAFIEINDRGVILDWNLQAEKMFGWAKEEAVGRLLATTIIPERFRSSHQRRLGLYRKTGDSIVLNANVEVIALKRDKNEFPVELSIFPVTTDEETTFCAFIRDITGKKRTEEILQQQADMLNLIHDAVILRDTDGQIKYWNKGAERMYGYTSEEALGKVAHSLLNAKYPKPFEEVEKNIKDEWYWEGELLHYTKDGKRLIVYSRQSLKVDTNDFPIAILEINSNVTVNKQAEQRRLALAEMKRVNAELEQFAYVASHDLQEPLRAVAGGLQILEKKYKSQLDDNASELISMAVDGAVRMRALISDLLSLSQVSTSKGKFETVNLAHILDEAVANLAVTIKDTSTTVTHDPLPVLMIEKARLVQLFQNLISNAIKFRGENRPEIHCGAEKKDGEWLFSIRDNGIGFEQKFADKIFELFKRLHTRDSYPGTGIGLSICKRIVERHGGDIWVVSKPGDGSTFYFTLPDNNGSS